MYCHQCGKEIGNVNYCPYCGVKQENAHNANDMYNDHRYEPIREQYPTREDDAPSGVFAVVSFFLPIVGIILYIIWHKDYPLKAKSCLKGTVIGLIISFVMTCCLFSSFIGIMENDHYYDEDIYFNVVVETIPYDEVDSTVFK